MPPGIIVPNRKNAICQFWSNRAIVFGTSYPVKREWLTEGVACVRAANLSDTDSDLVLGGTAQQLYGVE